MQASPREVSGEVHNLSSSLFDDNHNEYFIKYTKKSHGLLVNLFGSVPAPSPTSV
jgi:hypothetical protein